MDQIDEILNGISDVSGGAGVVSREPDIKIESDDENVRKDNISDKISEASGEIGVMSDGQDVSVVSEDDVGETLAVESDNILQCGIRYNIYIFIKRMFDIVSSLSALIILSPVLLFLLAIKWLEDFHNPVYVSKRVGKNGKIFNFYKIRSMRPDADQIKEQMIAEGLNEVDGPAFKMKDDPRITRVGKFLRKTSLDELLQLINILKGDMSVVGPRSPIPGEVEEYTEYQKHRFDVKGGLLCYWQITPNRHDIKFDDWVELDIKYIKTQSVWVDLKIIFKGAYMVFTGKCGD